MHKIAIILFNLGGPDKAESVEPFLFNLFNDKAIIGAPQPIRWLIVVMTCLVSVSASFLALLGYDAFQRNQLT